MRNQAQIRDIARRFAALDEPNKAARSNVCRRLVIALAMTALAVITGLDPASAQTPKRTATAAPLAPGASYVFDTLEFKDSTILDAIRVISGQSGANIVATSEAGKRSVSLFLRQSNIKQTIEAIARVAGLWYSYNQLSNVYMLMTVKEYQDDLVVFRQNYARSFTLRHQNVVDTARVIKALFGDRVSLTIGNDDALLDFQRQVGTLGTSGVGVGSSGIANTQMRQTQFLGTQTSQQPARSSNNNRNQPQLTPGQLSLLQDTSTPEAGSESGAPAQVRCKTSPSTP
jgi:general secretion pathway protein D